MEVLFGCMCGLQCSLWTIDCVVCTCIYHACMVHKSVAVWCVVVCCGVLCGVYCLKQSSTCHLKIFPQCTLPEQLIFTMLEQIFPQCTLPEQYIFTMLEQLWKLKGFSKNAPKYRNSVYLSCMLLFNNCDGQHTVHETTHMNTHETSWYTQETPECTQETLGHTQEILGHTQEIGAYIRDIMAWLPVY